MSRPRRVGYFWNQGNERVVELFQEFPITKKILEHSYKNPV